MARVRIEAGAEFDSLSVGELRGELDGRDARQQQAMMQDLRGIKPRRLPPMSGQVTAGGQLLIGGDSGQPQVGPTQGFMWFLRAITVNGLALADATDTSASGAIAAGAGSAALTVQQAATGFVLSFSAAPSTTGTATLSNVVGGPIVYDIPAGQTSPFTVSFPGPLQPSGGAPTLTVAGLGTGAGQIVLFGTGTSGGPDLVNMQIYGSGSGISWWQFGGGPTGPLYFTKWGLGEMFLDPGEYLAFASLPGAVLSTPAGTLVSVRGTILQIPAEKVGRLFGR